MGSERQANDGVIDLQFLGRGGGVRRVGEFEVRKHRFQAGRVAEESENVEEGAELAEARFELVALC